MDTRLRVASYNIRKAVGLDRRRDPLRILDVVNRLDADVVALQEADKRLGDRPTAIDRDWIHRETDFEVAALSKNDVSIGWHGNAVLVRKGLQILEVDHIDLPGLEPRGAVQVDLEKSGSRISLVGAHLGLIRSFRRKQLETIKRHLAPEGLRNALILGDFNEWSVDKGMEPLAADFDVISPGKSFHAARPLAGLDRIALGEAFTLYDAGVDESERAKIASDHLPIWSDVILEADQPPMA